MAASRILRLTVACRSKIRWLLALQVLVILLISFTVYRGTSWDGGTRHSGLFVNPNNLALIPFLLLFLIDPLRDKLFVRLGAHAIVVAVLAFSGTSGAVLAYAIGLTVHFRNQIPRRWRTFVYSLIPVTAVAGVAFLALNGPSLLPETRMTKQIAVMGVQLQNVLEGGEVAYYQQERVLGPGTASGIWRLAHWRHTVTTYFDGTPLEQLLGFGIGSSPRILGKLPHNEYLRILFEQGLIGFLLFMFAWRRIIQTAPAHVRYIGLIVAIYSFSENNLDNFPFMALFTLCLSARGAVDSVVVKVQRRLVTTWNTAVQQA
jgi:O-Antigen ligase